MSFARAGLAAPRGILGPGGTKRGAGLVPRPFPLPHFNSKPPASKPRLPRRRHGRARSARPCARSAPCRAKIGKEGGLVTPPSTNTKAKASVDGRRNPPHRLRRPEVHSHH